MMEPMDVDAVVGVLKRKQGVLGRMKKFTYVKKGVFLYEFKTSQHYDSDPPRRLYDISGAKVFPLDGSTNPSLSFRLVTRSAEEIDFVAEDDEEMKKWFDSLATTVERTSFMSCAALIAPVRRRQSSASFTMKKKFMKSISIVKIGKDAGIKEVDKATTLMFGLKEEDLIGQSVKALLVDDSCRRFLEHFKNYLADPASQARPAPVRNMNGYRKNKEEFPISLSLDKVDENTFRLKILDRSGPSMESAGNNEKDDFKTMATLRVDVMEGRDIGMSKKKTNPYCVILLDDTEKTTTTTKPNTTTPFWGQEYVFDDIKPTNKKVTIMINNQNKSIMDPRIGVVDINIFELNPGGRLLDKWFTVNPTPGSSTKSQGSPSIRLKIALTVEKILPFKEYKDILDLFLDEKLTCAMAVAKATTSQLDEVAGTLVNIFAMKNRVTDFVRKLTALEVSKTDRGNILFRGNSLGTKVIDLYMKMVGFDYLQETLTPLIEEVLHDKERCEVDPTRLLKGEDIKKNQKRLIMYTKKFFDRIAASVSKCPSEMKMVFSNLRAEVVKKFSDIENHTSVSGFIFLRFFCPAILNPKMFGITEEHPDGTAARNLTLIAKAIQNLANLVPQAKELFMTFMEEFLESQLKPMQDCVSQFCTLNEDSTFEFSGVVNKKDLSREMAALYRHCVDSKEQLMNTMLDDPDSKLNDLFKCLQALEKRQMEYERKALEQIKNHPIMHRPSISLSGIQE